MIHMQDLWRAPFEDPSLAELVDKIDQRAEAMSAFTVDDHRAMSYTEVPKGLCGAGLGDRQRSALRALTYAASAGPLQVDVNQNRWDDDNLNNLHIAWGGPLAETGPLYFRLQGPRLFFEYDNTQRDGNHVHTVLRDPLNDFGFDALRLHRSGMPHG